MPKPKLVSIPSRSKTGAAKRKLLPDVLEIYPQESGWYALMHVRNGRVLAEYYLHARFEPEVAGLINRLVAATTPKRRDTVLREIRAGQKAAEILNKAHAAGIFSLDKSGKPVFRTAPQGRRRKVA